MWLQADFLQRLHIRPRGRGWWWALGEGGAAQRSILFRVFARYQPGGLRPLLLHTLPVMKTLALCQNDIRELRHRNSIRGATSIRSPAQAAFSRNMVGMLRDAPAASGVATLSGKGSGKGDGKGKQARKVEVAGENLHWRLHLRSPEVRPWHRW